MAISNSFEWSICVTLVLSAHCVGYRRESRTELPVHRVDAESGSDEGHSPYRGGGYQGTGFFHEQWRARGDSRGFARGAEGSEESDERDGTSAARSRSSTRADNGTFKIINISPTSDPKQRDSKDEAAVTRLRDSIVFPEQPAPARAASATSATPPREFSPAVTEDCKEGDTLCLAVPNYPENYIANILSNSADELRERLTEDELEPVRIAQRIGEDPDELELCTFQERVVYPQAAQNKDSKWLMVINQQNYKQGFRVEVCQKTNSGCNPAVSFRLGMEAYCKQKYVLRKMAAVDEFGQLVMDSFRLPSCCSCVIRYVDAFNSGRRKRATRIGEP